MNGYISRRPSRLLRVAVVASLAGMVLAACGSGSSSSQTTTSTKVNDAAAKLVPAAFKDSGTLIVATDATFPPSAYYAPGKKLVGFDVDLANAIAASLGLQPKVQAESFDSIIPGIESGKFTVGMSLVNVTTEREGVLDFVSYFQNGSSLLAPTDTSLSADMGLADLCGHSVAVQRAAVQAGFAQDQSKKCQQAGKPPVDVKVFPDYNAATLAIAGGRVELGLFDQTNAAYTASKAASKLKVIGAPFGQTPCGIATKKGNGLAPAIQAALQGLIKDGTYQTILKQYGLEDGAVTSADINPSVS